MEDIRNKQQWQVFYKNWKEIWRNPEVSIYIKVVLYNISLYRSDNEGWYISERKLADDLGIGKESASKAIDEAIKNGWLLTNNTKERKRRKLRLSGPLQAPVRVSAKPNNWVSSKPTKYQREYQNNNSFKKETREGKMEKALTSEEMGKRIEALRKKPNSLWRKSK